MVIKQNHCDYRRVKRSWQGGCASFMSPEYQFNSYSTTESLLKQTQKEIEDLTGRSPLIIPCDVSSESDVERMSGIIRKNFHHIDVLINNAGIGIHKISEGMSNEEMRKQFEVNFYGPFYCVKALLPLLKLSDSPYILNIGSLVGEISFADNSIYAATKSALSCFSDGLRSEMKRL